ncbi:hypothetical protein N9K56_06070, partial [Planktomarina temperata]|nr:hypothetical protein [Planktomarina temperata]
SSREAAVYALVDSGIRAVFAPSFGDIFASNAVNNGLLPAQIDEATYETLSQTLERRPQTITIDLGARSLQLGSVGARFSIDDSWALKLINGWDDIDLTRHHRAAIAVQKYSISNHRLGLAQRRGLKKPPSARAMGVQASKQGERNDEDETTGEPPSRGHTRCGHA